MSSLSWMPAPDENNPAGPPAGLQAAIQTCGTYTVQPMCSSNNIIDGWSLAYESDGQSMELGHFDDVVDAQLYAQQHHDQASI